jgi:hypothetical protein
MQRFRFPIAVALTSLGLVAVLFIGGGLLVRSALAFGPWSHGGFGPPWARGDSAWAMHAVPAELAGLRDLPAGERFTHFKSAQLTLTDQNNQPVVVGVTPGTATAVDGASLTVATNDGPSRTFTLDGQTVMAGPRAFGSTQSGQATVNPGDKLVVVTLNGSATAHAVWSVNPDQWDHHGPFAH